MTTGLGNNLDPMSTENMARMGDAKAIASLMQAAMKPAVLAVRY